MKFAMCKGNRLHKRFLWIEPVEGGLWYSEANVLRAIADLLDSINADWDKTVQADAGI